MRTSRSLLVAIKHSFVCGALQAMFRFLLFYLRAIRRIDQISSSEKKIGCVCAKAFRLFQQSVARRLVILVEKLIMDYRQFFRYWQVIWQFRSRHITGRTPVLTGQSHKRVGCMHVSPVSLRSEDSSPEYRAPLGRYEITGEPAVRTVAGAAAATMEAAWATAWASARASIVPSED